MKIRSATIAICLGCLLYFGYPVMAQWLNAQQASWLFRQEKHQASTDTPRATETPPTTSVTLANARVTELRAETANLVITKSSSPTIVKAGDPLTYTILVTNTGTAAAQNLIIYDELPAGVRFQGESNLAVSNGTNVQLHVSARILTGTIGILYPTGRVSITGKTVVELDASGTTLRNTAHVTGTNDSTPNNNQGSSDTVLITATPTATPTPMATATQTATPTATPTATTLPDLADLQITKSVAPDPLQIGTILTYTIQVNNLGPGNAQNVSIRDTLPNGLLFVGPSSLSVSRGEQPQLLLSSASLTGTVSLLQVGGIITITASARVRPTVDDELLINQITVTSTTPDNQPTNNQAAAPVTLLTALPYKSYLPSINNP